MTIGRKTGGGSRKGRPNKIPSDVRAMLLAALERAGGEDYLLAQAHDNPRAFLSLLGRIIPAQVTGKDDAPLIPESAADPERLAQALLAAFKSLPQGDASSEAERKGTGG